MGRELKRVPLDFDWPLKKVWHGYLNPYHSTQCPSCESGLSPEAELLSKQWYGNAPFSPRDNGVEPVSIDAEEIEAMARRNIKQSPFYYGSGDHAVRQEVIRLHRHFVGQWAHHLNQDDVDALIAADRLHDFLRRPRNDEQRAELAASGGYWLKEQNRYRPTADEVNRWSLTGMAHDSINRHVVVEARCKRDGVPYECARCNGSAEIWQSKKVEKLAEKWKPVEPPKGDGFQLWETTSEGSPTSPVFATIEELCDWCAVNATTFADNKVSAEKWRSMLDAGFVAHVEGNAVFL